MNGLGVRLLPYSLAFLSSLCIMVLELVASRLVARHVGASLTVWTSVIGIILGGICLGNVLGGRLADRVEPRRAVGPLLALGSMLTLSSIWINAYSGLTPDVESLPWLRTVIVVSLDFLVPATVLGMIGPVVAKMAVEQSTKSGRAVGLVYFTGAVGSIVGTFLAGFILMYYATTTTIVTVVAAALAFLSAGLMGGIGGISLAILTGALLGAGSIAPLVRMIPVEGLTVGTTTLNPLALAGNAGALLLGIFAIAGLVRNWMPSEVAYADAEPFAGDEPGSKVTLTDLAVLSFLASLAFMAFEMVAGRLVTRHLGSSIYGWTSVIGVMLGGLSLGNLLGGLLADRIRRETQASWLFLACSILTLTVLFLESPPRRLVWNPYENWVLGQPGNPILGSSTPVLSRAVIMSGYAWPARVLIVVTAVFFLPSLAMGTVSPVVAKLAVDRLRRSKRTGRAIGQVYAWGMVGSILGTFLTGFYLIDIVGTKGMLLVLSAMLAFAATFLGTVTHAAWAGIPLGLCIIAFVPSPWFEKQGLSWGIREEQGDPETSDDALAWVDESDYYYIKVTNEPDAEGKKRTLVLDNLIHGYFILGHPERLDYDYEHIYALVGHRVAQAKAKKAGKADLNDVGLKTMFLGGGAYTFPRYLQNKYPGTAADVAEIDPAVTRANHIAMGLPEDTPIQTTWGDARAFVERNQGQKQYDLIFGDAFNDFSVPWHLTTREFNEKLASMMTPDGVYMINIIDVYKSDQKAEERAEQRQKVLQLDKKPADLAALKAEEIAEARKLGGFLGSWVNTARLTFPHIYVFGTDNNPGSGLRETFVVVASKTPLELDDLGSRPDDPRFFADDYLFEPRPYGPEHMEALQVRSRGIELTDDYAPVENLLAPVAETRGDD